jgi:uncharacterized membrane protein YbhN (UPF0104 family)
VYTAPSPVRGKEWQVNEKYRKWLQAIKPLLSVSIACFLMTILLIKLWQHYDILFEQKVFLSPPGIILSLPFLILSYFFIPYMWRMILESLEVSVSYRKAFQIQYLSHLGKYIPGKVWPYLAQSYLASQAKIPVKTTLLSNAILMCLMSIGSFLVFALSFLSWNIFPLSMRYLVAFLSFFLAYIFLSKNILEKCLIFLKKYFKHVDIIFPGKFLNYPRLFTALFLNWVIFWIGLYIMINSFYNISLNRSVIIVGAFSISWLVGYYAFLSPGGLGVQEGVQVYLLQFFFPLPISIVIALAVRLWMTIGDLGISLLAVALLMYENRSQESVHGAPL